MTMGVLNNKVLCHSKQKLKQIYFFFPTVKSVWDAFPAIICFQSTGLWPILFIMSEIGYHIWKKLNNSSAYYFTYTHQKQIHIVS